MRRATMILFVGMALLLAACPDDNEGACRVLYCDDSGCHACDPDSCFCWDINNSPCEDGCEANEVCTPEGICARPCSFDANCNEGERCLAEGYCGPADPPNMECADDDDCGAGLICEDDGEGGKICVPGCQSDDECQDGYVCAECGRCVPKENPVCGDTKTYCSNNTECGAGRICNVAGKCIYQCEDSSSCPYGQVCGEEDLCIEDPNPNHEDVCVYSTDCASVAHCVENGCMCINTYCHPRCDVNEDCGPLELCDMGICRANYRP